MVLLEQFLEKVDIEKNHRQKKENHLISQPKNMLCEVELKRTVSIRQFF